MDDLKWLLRTAYLQHGLLVCISLWSHDILAVRRFNSVANRARAVHMMTDDAATAAYINAALLPMIKGLQDDAMSPGGAPYTDAVLAWEVMNEPEGVSLYWRLYKVGVCVYGGGSPFTLRTYVHACACAGWFHTTARPGTLVFYKSANVPLFRSTRVKHKHWITWHVCVSLPPLLLCHTQAALRVRVCAKQLPAAYVPAACMMDRVCARCHCRTTFTPCAMATTPGGTQAPTSCWPAEATARTGPSQVAATWAGTIT